MASMNYVIMVGNLTADVVTRAFPSGQMKANLRLAVNDDYVGKDGQKVERICFVDVEAWGMQAESCQQYLSGSPVLVEGRLQLDTDSEKRKKLLVHAKRVQLLSSSGSKRPVGPEGEDAVSVRSDGNAALPQTKITTQDVPEEAASDEDPDRMPF